MKTKVPKSHLLALAVFIIAAAVFFDGETLAGTGENVSGWAWSENIGWISFNSTNCDSDGDGITDTGNQAQCPVGDPIISYGVNVDLSTGKFSGWAWSENIGWIKFDPGPDFDTGSYPENPQKSAEINFTNNKVSGWARVCAGTVNGDCNSSTKTEGWEGWIKMRGTSPNYGVVFNSSTDEFEGWAWGSDVVGWISFNHLNCDPDEDGKSNGGGTCPPADTPISDYAVKLDLNLPPYIEGQTIEYQAYCGVAPRTGQVGFQWVYRDDDGDIESKFDFRVNDVNNINDLNPEVDRTIDVSLLNKTDGSFNNQIVLVESPLGADKITYKTTYYWWVRVRDINNANSGWLAGPSFITEPSAYPWADFYYSPAKPATNETIQFTDSSTCYDSFNSPISCSAWEWDFENDGITDSTEQNPTSSYADPGSKTVKLIVSDEDNSCSINKTINIGFPLPEWREIPPVGWLEVFLANISRLLTF